MRYTKHINGEVLKNELKYAYDPDKISRWAHQVSMHIGHRDSEEDLSDILDRLSTIELPEFEYSEEEFQVIVEKLCRGENPFK